MTYSNIRDGFHDGGSASATACGIPVAWDTCDADIMTSDCTPGESPLVSPGPAEMGGEMGWPG